MATSALAFETILEPILNAANIWDIDERVKGAGDSKVMLPFEGDRTLSLILSKAFLLANDTKINDQSILRQMAL